MPPLDYDKLLRVIEEPVIADNPILAKVAVREQVNKRVVMCFGAKPTPAQGYGKDIKQWDIEKKDFTLEEIAGILEENDVGIPAGEFVKERLGVNYGDTWSGFHAKVFFFHQVIYPDGIMRYRPDFNTEYKFPWPQ